MQNQHGTTTTTPAPPKRPETQTNEAHNDNKQRRHQPTMPNDNKPLRPRSSTKSVATQTDNRYSTHSPRQQSIVDMASLANKFRQEKELHSPPPPDSPTMPNRFKSSLETNENEKPAKTQAISMQAHSKLAHSSRKKPASAMLRSVTTRSQSGAHKKGGNFQRTKPGPPSHARKHSSRFRPPSRSQRHSHHSGPQPAQEKPQHPPNQKIR